MYIERERKRYRYRYRYVDIHVVYCYFPLYVFVHLFAVCFAHVEHCARAHGEGPITHPRASKTSELPCVSNNSNNKNNGNSNSDDKNNKNSGSNINNSNNSGNSNSNSNNSSYSNNNSSARARDARARDTMGLRREDAMLEGAESCPPQSTIYI